MLSPFPKDPVLEKPNTFTRPWRVWINNMQNLVNFGQPPSKDTGITAVGGIKITSTLMRIESATAGNVTITANPQITAGNDGQIVKLEGLDNVKTVTMNTGNGVVLKGASPIVINENVVIQFHFNKANNIWIENFRNN